MPLLYVLVGLALVFAAVILVPVVGPAAYLCSFAGGWIGWEGLKNI